MRCASRLATSSVITRPAWTGFPQPDRVGEHQSHSGAADRSKNRNELVRFESETSGLDRQQCPWAQSLLEEKRLMVDQPIGQRRRPIRTELVLDWLDLLEWRKKVEFLAENCVFQAAQAKESLQTETLRGDDLPPESPCKDFCSRE